MTSDTTTESPRPAIECLQLLIAVIVYALFARAVLVHALDDDRVVSASTLFAVNGPFPVDSRNRAPEGVGMLSDSMIQFEPWRELQARRWAEGDRLPLWKDNTYCGAPFLANGQSAPLYPPHLISAWLGHPPGTNFWLAFFHFLTGAVGSYLLLRHLSCGFLGSMLGGAVFGFCAFQAIHVLHPHLRVTATLPWFLLAVDRLVLAPSRARFAAAALLAAWQHFAGHPETTFHVQLVGGGLAIVRAIAMGGGRAQASLRVGWCLAACVLGVMISAVQILPFLEYLRESTVYRFRHGEELFGKFALEGVDARFAVACAGILLALRWLRGAERLGWIVLASILLCGCMHWVIEFAREEGSITPPIVWLAPDWMGDPNRWKGPDAYWVHCGHFVGPAFLLSFFAFLVSPRRSLVWLGVALIALGISFGVRSPILSELLEKLPLFSQTVNRKLSFLAPMGAALLAALAVDAAHGARGLRFFAARFALGILAIVAPILASIVPFTGAEERGTDILTQKLERAGTIEAGGFGFEPAPWNRPDGSGDPRAGKILIHGWVNVDQPPSLADVVFRTGERAWLKVDSPASPLDRGSFADVAVPEGARAFTAEMIGAVMSRPVGWYRVRVAFPDGLVARSDWVWSEGEAPWIYERLPEPYWPISHSGIAQLQWMVLAALALGLAPFLGARGATILVFAIGFAAISFVSVPIARRIVPVVPESHHFAASEGCRVLAAGRPQARFYSSRVGIFYSEIAAWYGLAEPIGNDAMGPARSEALVENAIHGSHTINLPSHLPPLLGDRIDLRLLGLLGVRALVNAPDTIQQGDPAVGPVSYQIPGTMWVRENPYWLSRARLVANSEVIADEDAQLAAVLAAPRRLAEVVILDRGNVFQNDDTDVGTAAFAPDGDRGDRVVVDVAPKARCHLVLADTWFPGWRAFVDGVERPIRRANHAFRAVELSPRDRQVVFEYRPLSYLIGRAVSLGALLLVVLGIVVRRSE